MLRLWIAASLLVASLHGSQLIEARAGEWTYFYTSPGAKEPRPLLVLISSGGAASGGQWLPVASGQGWALIAAPVLPAGDSAVKALETILQDFRARAPFDRTRTYLAGQGEGASAVLYAAARRPDLWAAALAVGGSARPAIDSNRLFAANTQLVPVLWQAPPGEERLRAKMIEAGYNLDRSAPAQLTAQQAVEWLGTHHLDPFPQKVDCETGHPEFARCYWAEITKLDPSRRNDVLASSRVAAGSGAYLALGGFGFDPGAAGPGVAVGWLPENYNGPLRLGDRIVSIAGKQIGDAGQYTEFLDQAGEEKRLAVLVQRGKERIRIETRLVLPKREERQTARVQAEFLQDTRSVQIITRGVAGLRITLPEYWTPCPINWNGLDAGKASGPGCWAVSEGGSAQPCQ